MSELTAFVRLNAANLLTFGRLVMVPCFALAAVYYAASVRDGAPAEWLRWLAVGLFATASMTDALDGCLARRLNCQTRLGSFLDPIADKALLLTALLLLSAEPGQAFVRLPLWFPIVIVSRDLFVVFGVALIWMLNRQIEIRPHWVGKLATGLQMVTLGLVLLKVPALYWQMPLWVAGFCTVVSGVIYLVQVMPIFAVRKDSERH